MDFKKHFRVEMQRLPENLKKNGFNLTQIWRNEFAAIYEKWDKYGTAGYEVFKIKIQRENGTANDECEEKERYPSNEEFGKTAWEVRSIEAANDKIEIIKSRIQNRKK